MDFSSEQYLQLIIALGIAVFFFIASYGLPEKISASVLVLMIPFQPVTSSFGSINMVLVYIVSLAFLLRGSIRELPALGWVTAIIFAYMISFSQAPGYTRWDNIFYLLGIISNFILFYLVYNHIINTGRVKGFFKLLVVCNVLVVIYCAIQLAAGFEKVVLFGVSEFALERNRADGRLMGPFNAPGITAEYLVIQIFLLLYFIQYESSNFWNRLTKLLLVSNMGLLVATGNRTGILVLLVGGLIFAYMFRRELGGRKLVAGGVVAIAALIVVAVAVIKFSQFNVLFERFEQTEIREGGIDSRSVIWPLAFGKIMEKPYIGHGPRIRLIDEDKRTFPSSYKYMPQPHSMYLYLWYTLGFLGLILYLGFFFRLQRIFMRGRNNNAQDLFLKYMPKLSMVIWILFMVDQIKVSMFRFSFADYQHYIFALLGGVLAATVLAKRGNKDRVDPRIREKAPQSIS